MSPQSMEHGPSGGEDRTSQGDFLRSPGNLVGVGALAVVFVLVLLLSQSLPAALIAGLLGYGAGYFLAPDQIQRSGVETYSSGVPVTGATQEEVEHRLQRLRSAVDDSRRQLPPAARDELAGALGHLEEITARWDSVTAAPEQRHIVESIIYDYLPTTLDIFLRIPDTEKPHHAAEWTAQLSTLSGAIERSRAAVIRRDLEAIRTQGRLLEQRFEDGDLSMFREHGL